MLSSKRSSEQIRTPIRPSKSQDSADKLPSLPRLPTVKSATIAGSAPLVGTLKLCALDQTVQITFGDGCEFGFNGAWLIDSMPERRATDTYRTSAKGVSYLASEDTVVASLNVMGAGDSVVVTWSSTNPNDATTSTVPALWLRSWAPSVAQALNAAADTAAANEHGNLQHVLSGVEPARVGFGPLELAQKPWVAAEMTEPPVFQYDEILSDERVHLQFLSALAHPGFAFIDGIPTPELTPGAIGEDGAATIDEVSLQESRVRLTLVLRVCAVPRHAPH